SDSELIGISFMTPHFDRAVQISKALKKGKPDTPLVWGGIHAISRTEEALEYADAVCLGEGEEALVQLAQCLVAGKDYFGAKNFVFKKDDTIIRNPLLPLISDINKLPFLDYALEDDWVNDKSGKSFIKVDAKAMENLMMPFEDRDGNYHRSYRTMATRGCPHSCSYCGNSTLKSLYHGQRFLRRRSNQHIIKELEQSKAKYPFVGHIHFFDDTFFSASTESIIEFSRMYRERIDLPFHANCSPITINQEKYDALIDAGMVNIDIGLQSGSKKTMQIYNRKETADQFLNATWIIHSHSDKLKRFDVHIILDNPWEGYDDLKATMDVILKIPKPRTILPSGLIFFPGTKISEMAFEKGLSEDLILKSFRQHLSTPSAGYINYVFFLSSFNAVPNFVIKFLFSKIFYDTFNKKEFNRLFGVAYEATRLFAQLMRVLGAIRKGKISRKLKYIKYIRLRQK
ncbi:MAG: B12-binding domain-containing radical SAM protein, partial [Proteobacteria bacterium]|nr:B12-binding domain-containing radical SAM protein [Pseudomonadota bacterium]